MSNILTTVLIGAITAGMAALGYLAFHKPHQAKFISFLIINSCGIMLFGQVMYLFGVVNTKLEIGNIDLEKGKLDMKDVMGIPNPSYDNIGLLVLLLIVACIVWGYSKYNLLQENDEPEEPSQ